MGGIKDMISPPPHPSGIYDLPSQSPVDKSPLPCMTPPPPPPLTFLSKSIDTHVGGRGIYIEETGFSQRKICRGWDFVRGGGGQWRSEGGSSPRAPPGGGRQNPAKNFFKFI